MGGSDWRIFMRRHMGAIAALVVAAALVIAWSAYIFWWFTGNAQSSGLVPGTLGLWTMGNLVSFILYAIFWELLLVGVPVIIGVAVIWQWWRRLPDEERLTYRFWRSRSARGSGGVSFLIFIAFCLKVYLDGNWNVPISSFTLNYVVWSVITILEWAAVILGIPAAIALAWWLSREMRH